MDGLALFPRLALLLVLACTAFAQRAPPGTPAELLEVRRRLDDGQYAEAEARAGVELERLGANTSARALCEAWLGEARFLNGKQSQPETLALAQGALARARGLGEEELVTAECWYQLGQLYSKRDEWTLARPAFEHALAIREAALGPQAPEVAMALVFLANATWKERRDEARALELFARARTIQEVVLGPEHADVAWCLDREALVFMDLGRYAQARPQLERALAVREHTLRPGHPLIGVSLYNLGALARGERDWIAARDYHERALAVRRAALGPEHPHVVWSLRELGELSLVFGDYERAGPLFEEALAIQNRNGRQRELSTSVLALDVASVRSLAGSGSLTGARELAEAAIVNLRAMDPPELRELVWGLLLSADLAGQDGDPTRARSLLDEAREVAADRTWDGATEARLLRSEASMCVRDGDLLAAKELLERSLGAQEAFLGPEHADLEEGLYPYAGVLLRLGDHAGCVRAALRAERLFQDEWQRTAPAFEEQWLLALDDRFSRSLGLALEAAVSSADPELLSAAFAALISSRGLGFAELAERRRLVRSAEEPAVRERARALEQAQGRLSDLYVRATLRGEEPSLGDALDRARSDRGAAERALALATQGVRTHASAPSLAEIRGALPARSALLSFATLPAAAPAGASADSSLEPDAWCLAAFVLTPDAQAVRAVVLDDLEHSEKLVQDLRKSACTSTDEREYRGVGAELTRLLWKPVAPWLEGAELVFVVPAGPIHALDLASLPLGEHEYLLEKGPTFHTLSSERELLSAPLPRRGGQGLLALGGADFGTAAEPAARPALFGELKASRLEAARVAELFDAASPDEPVRLLSEGDASEGAFCANAPGRRVLHLATHGFELDATRATGAAARGIGGTAPIVDAGAAPVDRPGEIGKRALEPVAARDALLACGLALAHANLARPDDSEDGILTAEEISSLDLTGVEWAVLSSCDSGGGVLRYSTSKEGLLGLRRAFHLAGVRTVIANLWPVEDEAARQWSEEFYRARLVEGCDSPGAVRRASLALLARRRSSGERTHPRSFGGYISSGDWR